ncbi:unnamed protein product [Paramecium sonneborni]|uniref:Uncharacterized protein n=1 Tax=Paramecium sonneborni TaxID=65129 RepID=A0A8S1QQ06_9CILI|nr:unnamed protein product [Paramecium sonneborni]
MQDRQYLNFFHWIHKKKNTNKVSKNNQGAISSQLPEIQKKKIKNDMFRYSLEFQEILQVEQDERYQYLIKNGTIKKIQNEGNIIFSELQQIPGIWVWYRRKINYFDFHRYHCWKEKKNQKYQHFNTIEQVRVKISLKIKSFIITKKIKLERFIIQINYKYQKYQLHNNKITNLDGLNKLRNSLIQKVEGLENLASLIELNLKINQIELIDQIQENNPISSTLDGKSIYSIKQDILLLEFPRTPILHQHLIDIQKITIQNNPINSCSLCFHFLYIEFLLQFKQTAKMQEMKIDKNQIAYLEFDKALIIQEKKLNIDNTRQFKSYKKNQLYFKIFQKAE